MAKQGDPPWFLHSIYPDVFSLSCSEFSESNGCSTFISPNSNMKFAHFQLPFFELHKENTTQLTHQQTSVNDYDGKARAYALRESLILKETYFKRKKEKYGLRSLVSFYLDVNMRCVLTYRGIEIPLSLHKTSPNYLIGLCQSIISCWRSDPKPTSHNALSH